MTGSRYSQLLWRLIVCALFLGVLAANLKLAKAQFSFPEEGKIGPGVVDALRVQGEARVVVALADPQSAVIQSGDLARMRSETAFVQNAVISTLGPNDFRVSHMYQAVPALVGTALTEYGLIALARHPSVVRIDLDTGGTGALSNSVPLIGADLWHTKGITGSGVVVAVLDSGLDTDHNDLSGALIHQECFLDNNGAIDGVGSCPNGSDRQSGLGAAEDDAGHGTHVTGIVASRGERSSVGVAPGVRIVSIKVTAGPSFSGVFYYFSEIVAALDFIINNRPDVQIINMSLGTNARFVGDCDSTTAWNMAGAAAINTLRSRGVIAFASSGNNGSGTEMSSPACLSKVVSVGATDSADSVASFTNSSSSTDIMAPGVSILSSGLANGTTTASGTSMASPHAAGCAALLIQSGEAVTPSQIEVRLRSSSVQVADSTNGLTFPRIECAPRSPTSFDGPSLDPRWSWIREDPAHWNLSERPSFLRIYTQYGGLFQIWNNAKNLLLQSAPIGDFEIQTRVLFTPTSNFQSAGLLVYQDDDFYLSLTRGYCGMSYCKGNAIYFNQEEQGQTIGSTIAVTVTSQSEAYLRVLRHGTVYTGYVSTDGLDWVTVGSHTVVSGLVPSLVGLLAFNDSVVGPEIPADFDYFWLEDRSYRVMLPLVTRQ